MNILEQEDLIKGLPDAALMKEASAPSGQVPQFLVVSEIKRRSDMRKRYEQEQQPQGTVKDQIVMEAMGIAPMMPTAMTPPAQPMGPAGPPPNGAMPPPMGGMPPQGAPPMAPPMPQGMPPMPQGGIASAPPAMPPMGMAQGGIVQMQAGGALPAGQYRLFDGSTIAEKMAELLNRVRRGELAYADVLANISSLPASEARDMALSYVQSEAGGKRAPNPESKFRMDEGMFGYSDRDARVMGTMESPLPDRESYPAGKQGRELFEREFMDTLNANDAIFYGQNAIAPDASETDQGIMANLGMPTREQGQAADRSRIERIRGKLSPPIGPMGAIDVDSGIASMVSERAPRSTTAFDFLSMKGSDFGPLPEGKTVGPSPFERLVPEGGPYARQLASELNEIEDLTLYGMLTAGSAKDATKQGRSPVQTQGNGAFSAYTDYAGLFPAVAADEVATDEVAARPPFSLEFLQRENAIAAAREKARNEDFSTFAGEDIYRTAGAGTETTKGERTPATRATDAVTALPRNDRSDPDMPALDFSDLIAESKQQALANAMIQLGAGVASGDISKGLAAAGTAAMEGTADARALDMKRRLAEYQAGREDIRRGDETDRFERQMRLQERKVDISEEQFTSTLEQAERRIQADIDKGQRVSIGQLMNFVSDLVKESMPDLAPKGKTMQDVVNTMTMELMRKYAPLIDADISALDSMPTPKITTSGKDLSQLNSLLGG